MSNIFASRKKFKNQTKRNTFDKSFQNNFTTAIGRLTPTLCKEILPGESIKINAALGLRAMPLQFPIQTRLRVHNHFFYVPNRILCDKWESGAFGIKDFEFPWIKTNNPKRFCTNSLSDFLGVPTTIAGSYGRDINSYPIYQTLGQRYSFVVTPAMQYNYYIYSYYVSDTTVDIPSPLDFKNRFGTLSALMHDSQYDTRTSNYNIYYFRGQIYSVPRGLVLNGLSYSHIIDANQSVASGVITCAAYSASTGNLVAFTSSGWTLLSDDDGYYHLTDDNFINDLNHALIDDEVVVYVGYAASSINPSTGVLGWPSKVPQNAGNVTTSESKYQYPILFQSVVDDVVDASRLSSHPFLGNDPAIRISAFPYRAYESVCNAYYRNEQNNPLIIDGEPEYDRYCPNISDGADTFEYDFHYRNWELDAYTSAVQSPQFGVAPLIGITVNYGEGTADISLGPITITNPDGTTTSVANSTLKVGVHSDGVINSIINADGVPSGNLQLMMQSITQGISINDIRNANSYQRFLENTIRMGYKYRDQMLSHFGVEVPYPDLWMPQFIGGFSVDMSVEQINQTVETETGALGDYAGQASFVGKSGRPIRFTAHEHGYILCITSITPLPVYTQVLPKMFLRSHPFDFYNTEFSKIGYVPINYKELCPLQSAAAGDDVNDVFGYNRAWYDYVANLDEAHGAFRKSLKDYIMMRTFDSRPELGRDFLVIDPNQVNDVFAVRSAPDENGYDDKFLGCIYFDFKSQSPVPRFGVPALE